MKKEVQLNYPVMCVWCRIHDQLHFPGWWYPDHKLSSLICVLKGKLWLCKCEKISEQNQANYLFNWNPSDCGGSSLWCCLPESCSDILLCCTYKESILLFISDYKVWCFQTFIAHTALHFHYSWGIFHFSSSMIKERIHFAGRQISRVIIQEIDDGSCKRGPISVVCHLELSHNYWICWRQHRGRYSRKEERNTRIKFAYGKKKHRASWFTENRKIWER